MKEIVQHIEKIATGISGLDEILLGGLPKGRTTVMSGGPGAGKTMFGLEIVYRNANAGLPGLYVSFEESRDDVIKNAGSLGWDFAQLEAEGKVVILLPAIDFRAIKNGQFNIEGFLSILLGHARKINAQLIVIDAIDMLMRLFTKPAAQRDELYALHQWLKEHSLTTILTVKSDQLPESQLAINSLDFMADCVIRLDQRVVGQVNTRRLHVRKYRGSGFSSNEHPFVIAETGVVLMPLTSIELDQPITSGRVSSGHAQLDELLQGGYRKGTVTILSGPTGTGKTTLACLFAEGACGRGERVLYVSLEESGASIANAMLSIGIDLNRCVETQTIKILTMLPESLGGEEHLYHIFQAMDAFEPSHLILDAISAVERMSSQEAAFDFLLRLLMEAKKRHLTCIFTNQTSNTEQIDKISGIGISSLVDTAIMLEYQKKNDDLFRKLVVLKSRGSGHSTKYHWLEISEKGVHLEPISGGTS